MERYENLRPEQDGGAGWTESGGRVMSAAIPGPPPALQLELQENEGGREAASEEIAAKNFPNLVENISPEIPDSENPKRSQHKGPAPRHPVMRPLKNTGEAPTTRGLGSRAWASEGRGGAGGALKTKLREFSHHCPT